MSPLSLLIWLRNYQNVKHTLHLAGTIEGKANISARDKKPKWFQEGNVLFNDTLNTFYLRLYGIRQ